MPSRRPARKDTLARTGSIQTVRKAIFPAAGLGTRFLPATKAMPKEMLPLVDRPVIQYAVEEAVASGIRNIYFITGRGKNAIEDHFDVSPGLERYLAERGQEDLLRMVRATSNLAEVAYVRQKTPLGLGHAVWTARDLVGDEPFAVLLGDDVCEARRPVLRQILDVHARFGSSVLAVERVARREVKSYGIIAGERIGPRLYRVRDMIEKPEPGKAPSNLAVIGRYVLTPEIFAAIEATPPDRKGEIQLTNGLRRLLEIQPVYALEFEGLRLDTGTKLGFARAVVHFAMRHPELGPSFRRWMRTLRLRRA